VIDSRLFQSLSGDQCVWLQAEHHFSLADAGGWGALRIWNDEEIAPGTGFSRHIHPDRGNRLRLSAKASLREDGACR
jgi:quercetin 2,3-dioxygenase